MICQNCGYQLPDNAIFCEQCGARVAPGPDGNIQPDYQPDFQNNFQDSAPINYTDTFPAQSPDNAPKKSRTALYVAIAVAAVLIVSAGTGLTVWYLSNNSSGKGTPQTVARENNDSNDSQENPDVLVSGSETEDNTAADPESDIQTGADKTSSDSSTETAKKDTPFNIDPNADADYTTALDPSEYEFYSSSIDEFSFWYPTDFYNDVTYNTRLDTISYGTNIEEITFSADDGSQLIFQAVQRTDSMNLEEMSDYVYTSEMGRLTSAEVILNNVKNGSGKIVVTGWDSEHTDNTVYCLTKIKSDVILQMTVLFPDYTDEADQLRKSYLTECFYRMCGFSNADPWRTYEDFVREAG